MKVIEKFGCAETETYLEGAGEAEVFIAGIECEIESVKEVNFMTGFHKTQDGSLRNNGLEFISKPMNKDVLLTHFEQLHAGLKLGEDPFSVRTSTHVHVNVASLDVNAAKQMLLFYALFEEFFFMMVKPERRENIHCVPLTETYMPSMYGKPLETLVKNWHKYTALNLKRISDLGTMEFRHLHGTNNVKELHQWLSTLENLWVMSQREDLTNMSLTLVNITRWFQYLFKDAPKILELRPSLMNIMANNLIDVKLSF